MDRLFSAILFIFFVSISPALMAQSALEDSLLKVITQPGTPSGEHIEAMEQLARVKAAINELDQAITLTQNARKISYQEKDKRYSALVLARLSNLYARLDSLNLAFSISDSAVWYADQTKDKVVQGRVVQQKAWLEHRIDDNDNAYQHYLEALRLLEGQKDGIVYQCMIYHSLAAIQAQLGDSAKQQYYTKLCLKASVESQNPDAIANAYLGMGANYLYRFRKSTSRHGWLDSSGYYNQQVIQFTNANKDRMSTVTPKGIALLNMANLYVEFYPASYEDSAQVYLRQALKIGRSTDNPDIIVNSYGIMSEYELTDKNYKSAEKLLLKALHEIKDEPGNNESKAKVTHALSQVAEQSGQSIKALKYYKQYMKFNGKLFNERNVATIQKLEAQYHSEKRQIALKSALQEAAFTKKQNRYYLFLIAIGLIGLFFLYRSYHFKLKASLQKHLLLMGEKKKVELQGNLKAEETARLQAERKLMKERLNRMEKELLAGTLHVEEKNRLIYELKEKLDTFESDDPLYRQMSRLIVKSQGIDKGYNDIKFGFSEISPDLINGLQQKAENKLTPLDLKYCSYIYMGLTNKEIAIKLNVAPKSIRMARYRIKQKLQLDKDDSIDDFMTGL